MVAFIHKRKAKDPVGGLGQLNWFRISRVEYGRGQRCGLNSWIECHMNRSFGSNNVNALKLSQERFVWSAKEEEL